MEAFATTVPMNTEGNCLVTLHNADCFLNFHSRLTALPNGEIATVSAVPFSTQAEIVRLKSKDAPDPYCNVSELY